MIDLSKYQENKPKVRGPTISTQHHYVDALEAYGDIVDDSVKMKVLVDFSNTVSSLEAINVELAKSKDDVSKSLLRASLEDMYKVLGLPIVEDSLEDEDKDESTKSGSKIRDILNKIWLGIKKVLSSLVNNVTRFFKAVFNFFTGKKKKVEQRNNGVAEKVKKLNASVNDASSKMVPIKEALGELAKKQKESGKVLDDIEKQLDDLMDKAVSGNGVMKSPLEGLKLEESTACRESLKTLVKVANPKPEPVRLLDIVHVEIKDSRYDPESTLETISRLAYLAADSNYRGVNLEEFTFMSELLTKITRGDLGPEKSDKEVIEPSYHFVGGNVVYNVKPSPDRVGDVIPYMGELVVAPTPELDRDVDAFYVPTIDELAWFMDIQVMYLNYFTYGVSKLGRVEDSKYYKHYLEDMEKVTSMDLLSTFSGDESMAKVAAQQVEKCGKIANNVLKNRVLLKSAVSKELMKIDKDLDRLIKVGLRQYGIEPLEKEEGTKEEK